MSDNQTGFIQDSIGKLGDFFSWISETLQDPSVRRSTLINLGLDPDKEKKDDDENNENKAPEVKTSAINQYRNSVNPDEIAYQSALIDIQQSYESIKGFVTALIDDPTDYDEYLWHFFELMGTDYMRFHHPTAYWWCQLLGFLVDARVSAPEQGDHQGIIAENLWSLLTNPFDYIYNFFKHLGKAITGKSEVAGLDTMEDAEAWSGIFLVLAGLMTYWELSGKKPEGRWLYNWDKLPKKWEDTKAHKEDLYKSFQGDRLLEKIRKEIHKEFPKNQAIPEPWKGMRERFPKNQADDKAWEEIEKIRKEDELNEIEKQIVKDYQSTIYRWQRGDWEDLVSERTLSFDFKLPGEGEKYLGATFIMVSDEEVNEDLNKKNEGIQIESLGGLFVAINGEANIKHDLDKKWAIGLKSSSGELVSFYLSRLADLNLLGDMQIELTLHSKPDKETGATYNIPDATGSRLAIGTIHMTAMIAKGDIGIEIGLKDNAIVISGGKSDGFLQEILPKDDVPLKFSLAAGFTKNKGFYFNHDIGALKDVLGALKDIKGGKDDQEGEETTSRTLASRSAEETPTTQKEAPKEIEKNPFDAIVPIHKDMGIINFESIDWGYGKTKKQGALGANLHILTTFSSKLGPVYFRVDKIGADVDLSMPNNGGDLSNIDLDFGFKAPESVGIRIESPVISGGGFLKFEPDHHRYSGVLALKFWELELAAIGLINTRLPNNQKGFSMLISISVFFDPPIQLSFGFTLNAVGGLVGIHRTMKVDVLRERIHSGAINSVMFPENVIENAPKIISDLRVVFPPQKSHYVVAPFLRIGYGSPTIVEVDLGILAEIPFKGRLILLGRVGVYLPNKKVDKRLVEINVDIFGDFNFAQSYVLIEGRLRKSQVVGIALSGGFAFVLDWGKDPQFLFSIGGYHPRYKKPTRFPVIPRLRAEIKKGDNFRLTCQYYQAITSNSFQIGFSADLLVKKGRAKATGFLGFNALIQFDPFYFETDISISVSVSYRGRSFFGVELHFLLSGPKPWTAKGYAKIKILFFSLKVRFNISWGGKQEKLSTTIQHSKLMGDLHHQLSSPSNWTAKLPPNFAQAEALRSIEEDEQQGQIFVHPSGFLEVRQNLVPLNRTIEKVGHSYVEQQPDYRIESYSFGDKNNQNTDWQKPLLEYFSRGQYEDLSDAEQLSTADFDLMPAGFKVQANNPYDFASTMKFTENTYEDIFLKEEEDEKQMVILAKKGANWQAENGKNLRANIGDALNPSADAFGFVEQLPDYDEASYKIVSTDEKNLAPGLENKYFASYGAAKDYLHKHWAKADRGNWQIEEVVDERREVELVY